MKSFITTALLAGAAAFIPTQSQADERPGRSDTNTRGAVSVTVQDGRISGIAVRYDERDTDRRDAGRDDDRRDDNRYVDRRDDGRRDNDRYDGRDNNWRDDGPDRQRGRDNGDLIRYRGKVYLYKFGRFFERDRHGWDPTAAPIGIVVDQVSPRAQQQRIRGEFYLVLGDTYYQRTRGGYVVVREPSRHGNGHGYGWGQWGQANNGHGQSHGHGHR
jgi:hypothetical protein